MAFFLCSSWTYAESVIPKDTRQVMVVVTESWDAPSGTCYLLEQDKALHWHLKGRFLVQVGRRGLAWGLGIHPEEPSLPQKLEGDKKAPAGVFYISARFSTLDNETPQEQSDGLKFIDARSMICVDDVSSLHYNQVIEPDEQVCDWTSKETMKNPFYPRGFLVEHNPFSVPGYGSCIFMHLEKGPGIATVGCTSMNREHLDRLWNFFKKDSRPVLVQLPRDEYDKHSEIWGLPALP